jgi:hypothetical protein
MLEGRTEHDGDILEAHRMAGIFRLAHTMASMFNANPFRTGDAIKAKDVYEELTAEDEDDGPFDWVVEDGIATRVPRER